MSETKIPFRAVVSSEVIEALLRLLDDKIYGDVRVGHEDEEVGIRFCQDLSLIIETFAQVFREPLREFVEMQNREKVE